MGFIFWGILLLSLVFLFEFIEDHQQNPNRDPQAYQSTEYTEVILKRNRQGHYVVSGTINQYPVVFLLDTGATNVSIPENLATAIGLTKGRVFSTLTANGIGKGYATRVESLQFGNIRLANLAAGINPNMPGSEVLLGMSVLKQLEFRQSGDQLIVRQYKPLN